LDSRSFTIAAFLPAVAGSGLMAASGGSLDLFVFRDFCFRGRVLLLSIALGLVVVRVVPLLFFEEETEFQTRYPLMPKPASNNGSHTIQGRRLFLG
jgi:hypothetical protein